MIHGYAILITLAFTTPTLILLNHSLWKQQKKEHRDDFFKYSEKLYDELAAMRGRIEDQQKQIDALIKADAVETTNSEIIRDNIATHAELQAIKSEHSALRRQLNDCMESLFQKKRQ